MSLASLSVASVLKHARTLFKESNQGAQNSDTHTISHTKLEWEFTPRMGTSQDRTEFAHQRHTCTKTNTDTPPNFPLPHNLPLAWELVGTELS